VVLVSARYLRVEIKVEFAERSLSRRCHNYRETARFIPRRAGNVCAGRRSFRTLVI
jgi:hypothetical protein